jgi:hypothetical protein
MATEGLSEYLERVNSTFCAIKKQISSKWEEGISS